MKCIICKNEMHMDKAYYNDFGHIKNYTCDNCNIFCSEIMEYFRSYKISFYDKYGRTLKIKEKTEKNPKGRKKHARRKRFE